MAATMACLSLAQTQLYVSNSGNDSWSGLLSAPNATSTDGPKASLYGARDAIRAMKTSGTLSSLGAVVNVAAGSYRMPNYLDMQVGDSGAPGAPIIYQSTSLHGAVLEGGVQIKNWSALDSRLLPRVQPSVAASLVCANLGSLGVTDFGYFPTSSWCGNNPSDAIELFVNGKRQTCARWPNSGYATITAPVAATPNLAFTANLSTCHTPSTETDVWLCGFPCNVNWAWDSEQVNVNPSTSTITESRSQLYGNKAGGRFFIKNSLEELDAPGEYYVDKATGLLVWYPTGGKLRNMSCFASVNSYGPLVRMQNVSNVSFQGFVFQHARSDAVTMKNCANDSFVGNTIQLCGGSAAVLTEWPVGSSHDNLFKSNMMCDLGEYGMYLQTGNRLTLQPSNNVIQNNVITRYGLLQPSYRAGVHADGVGIQILHNNISFGPHQAIQVGGCLGANNNVVDGNHIWDVCMDSADAGAVYSGGHDGSQRGNVFTNNLIEDVYARLPGSTSIWAMYMDSHGSGNYLAGNIIRNVNSAVLVEGGRDNFINNNVFTGCKVNAIQVDDRCGDIWPDPNLLLAVNYQYAPYSNQYPLLPNILNDYPAYPEGNLMSVNAFENAVPIYIRTGSGVHTVNSTERNPYYVGWMNDISGTGLFTNEAGGDYTPVPGSPLALAGFQALNANFLGAVSDAFLTVPTPNPTP